MSVKQIIKDVYGTQTEAGRRFGIRQNAVSNWVKAKGVPGEYLPQIVADAQGKGLALDVSDIPVTRRKRRSDA